MKGVQARRGREGGKHGMGRDETKSIIGGPLQTGNTWRRAYWGKRNAAPLNMKMAEDVFHKIHMTLSWEILNIPLKWLLFDAVATAGAT